MDADRDRRERLLATAVLVCVAAGLAALAGRLVHINTTLAGRLNAHTSAQQKGTAPIPARRGLILDRAGRTLAGTRMRPSVFADPALIDEHSFSQIARRLGPVLDLPAGQIEQTLRENRDRRFCWLKRAIAPAEAEAVKQLKIHGIRLRNEPQRYYPLGPLMAQTIGIVSRDGRGLEGVELRYDVHLRSRDGRRVSIYDARSRRRPIWSRLDGGSPSQDGGDVVLTLDAVVQGFLEDQIAETVTKFEAESGVGVVMSPITGDILAMGQYPTFDPNRYAASPPEARRNRVIGDALEPGSTFKPYVASGALASGFVSPGERIFCHLGQHYFGGRLIHDSSPRGELTFEEILSKSSNIGMAILGQRMGNQTIHRTVRLFGFGSPTGVDLPGEASGLVAPLARWTSYSTTSVPFGQEIAVTAIQLATGLCAIVNGGTLLKPRVTKALLGPDGELLESFDGPQVIRRVMPPDVADYMAQKVLVGVVKNGGGKTAALSDWQVLGKTGTAQIAYADRPGYEPEAYMSSFIGAAPAENPQVVVVVMIRKPNPQLGYYGSKVAAPAVGRILEKTLSYLGVPPSPRMGNDQEVFRDTATRLVKIAEVHPG